MKFITTNSTNKILDDIKKRVAENFAAGKPEKFKVKFTKKKEGLIVPIPFTYAAFQLFIDEKFYQSYMQTSQGSWMILKD